MQISLLFTRFFLKEISNISKYKQQSAARFVFNFLSNTTAIIADAATAAYRFIASIRCEVVKL